MWRTLCVSATVGVGVSVAVTMTDWHLFADSNFQGKPTALLADHSEDDFKQASVLLEQGHAEEALKYLQDHEDKLTYENPNGQKWVNLAVDINTALYDSAQLTMLYRHFPEAFKGREEASLLVGNNLILHRENKPYSTLRNTWKGNENNPVKWLLLDVDSLLLSNQRADAIKLLESHSFAGELETNRLVRLALLTIQNDPKAAWDYLNEAQGKDPNNIDVYTYRARLLESVGKNNLALAEYMTALEVDPENIFIKDLLADFYVRNGKYQQALALWKESLDQSPLETIWLKTLFWNRMMSPPKEDWKEVVPPLGKLHDLNLYLVELASSKFWDQKNFEKIPNAGHFLSTQQATFWFRLLEELKSGQEESALKLLQENPFVKKSWNPSLERALKQLLVYRLTGNVDTSISPFEIIHGEAETEENAFFTFLDSLAKQPALLSQEKNLKALLSSNEAFVIAFLSAGWLEAGLQLHDQTILSSDLPDWVAVAITEAINANRGYEEALQFAMMQSSSSQLSALMGDLLKLAKNNSSFALALKKIAAQDTERGMKAAWLLSLIYIERGNYQAAKQSIQTQFQLSKILLGKETLARIALLEGNSELANQIYLEIEPQSIEAKSYLARIAYNQKDWVRAKALTQQLLNIYPDNPLLQENLRKISQAAK